MADWHYRESTIFGSGQSSVWNVNYQAQIPSASVTTTLCTYHTMTHHSMTHDTMALHTMARNRMTNHSMTHHIMARHKMARHRMTQPPHSAPTTQWPNYHIVPPPPQNDKANSAPQHGIPNTANLPSSFIQRKFLKLTLLYLYANYAPPRGGGTPRKIGWGCAARFPKPLPYLWPKSAIFPTLFMTWLLNQNSVFDQRYNNFPSSDQC